MPPDILPHRHFGAAIDADASVTSADFIPLRAADQVDACLARLRDPTVGHLSFETGTRG
jgi:hypothetical protein